MTPDILMTPAQIINVSSIPPSWHLTAKIDKPVSEEVVRPSSQVVEAATRQETDIFKMIENAM